MMVNPARRMLSAISLGVLWRAAPSTRVIIRSRNVSPGLEVILTLIWSLRTRVPPVTAERSPPASRITGADSPVMADSSTEATPSVISPSPGISSPAETRTKSPVRSLALATCSIFPEDVSRFAMVSDLALRRVSACALPRPSAMASAKLAKSTVNHSQSVICRLKRKAACGCKTRSTVVITLPISTTNMTGFDIMLRGLSLRTELPTAFRISFRSQIDLLWLAIGVLESLPGVQQQVFQNWSQTQCRKERQSSENQNDANQQE